MKRSNVDGLTTHASLLYNVSKMCTRCIYGVHSTRHLAIYHLGIYRCPIKKNNHKAHVHYAQRNDNDIPTTNYLDIVS